MKKKTSNAPCCVFCKKSHGAQFNIFTPRFKPFGTACVECEKSVPAHFKTPEEYLAKLPATPPLPTQAEVETRPSFYDCTHAFAVPGEDNIIDMVRPDTQPSCHYNQNLEEMRQRYPEAQIVNATEFFAAIRQRKNPPLEWEITTRENYWNMLEVLPPKYHRNGAFLVGEAMDHFGANGAARYDAFKQVGSIYYQSNRPVTVAEIKAHMEQTLATA